MQAVGPAVPELDPVRGFVHVDDVAEAFVAAVERGGAEGGAAVVNVGGGAGRSVMDVVRAVEKVSGRRVFVAHGPPAREAPVPVADPARARSLLDWIPRRSDLTAMVDDEWQRLRVPGPVRPGRAGRRRSSRSFPCPSAGRS